MTEGGYGGSRSAAIRRKHAVAVEEAKPTQTGSRVTPAPAYAREIDAMNRATRHILSAPIRQRLNRIAHAAGAKHADETRTRLLSEFVALWEAGASPIDLTAR